MPILMRGNMMANANKTSTRPDNVPEENVYETVHWTIYLGYGVAVLSLAALLFGSSL